MTAIPNYWIYNKVHELELLIQPFLTPAITKDCI